MQSNLDRRIRRVEELADNILTHRECAEITLALLGLFKAGMVKHLDDPVLLWELLNEMTGDASRTLEPLGYGIGWRMP
jgi:hypothetical protein